MNKVTKDQLTIWEVLEEILKREEAARPYRNGLGELLPWEVDESSLRSDKQAAKGGE